MAAWLDTQCPSIWDRHSGFEDEWLRWRALETPGTRICMRRSVIRVTTAPPVATAANQNPCKWKQFLCLPLCGSSLLHMGHDDAVRGAFGPSATRDLNAQAILTLHHVHLPDPAALTGLRTKTEGDIYNVWWNNQECALLYNTKQTAAAVLWF